MHALVKIVTLLAATAATAALEGDCELRESALLCDGRGLSAPPAGSWPGVRTLSLNNNGISQLTKDSFSGFPDLRVLELRDNGLTLLELEVLAAVSELEQLTVSSNRISSVVAAPAGVVLNNLKTLTLYDNALQSLAADALASAPNLESLALNGNPLQVEESSPILNQAKLTFIDLRVTKIPKLTAANLAGLPKLQKVWLDFSDIVDVSGAFVDTPLEELDLSYTKITQVPAGTFSATNALRKLLLQGSQLSKLEAESVNGVVAAGGEINIRNTPLACSCDYEILYWWAAGRGVTIDTYCSSVTCSFGRR